MIKQLIIFVLFFSLLGQFFSSLGQPCNEFCKTCENEMWPNCPPNDFCSFDQVEYCTECYDGYYLDDSKVLNKGCIKRCVQSYNKTDCKVCDPSEKGKCFECWDNYILSKDRKNCEPKFVICDGEEFLDCVKCENNEKNNTNITNKCAECRHSYKLNNGYCEYDVNGANSSKYIIKGRIFIIKNILLTILLLFL